jgi:putative RNA 2'-phosphotransferase
MEPSFLIQVSKYLSLVLRHKPGKIGLAIDEHGWADVNELLLKLEAAGLRLDRATLEMVVEKNDKKRFTFSPDGQKIRASQGHSIPVDLDLEPVSPPELLYHGTALRFLQSIQEKGLLPKERNHVHLSKDVITAWTVGKRHGQPVVFLVKARQMEQEGYLFFLSANGVWLTAAVPPHFLVVLDKDDPA